MVEYGCGIIVGMIIAYSRPARTKLELGVDIVLVIVMGVVIEGLWQLMFSK